MNYYFLTVLPFAGIILSIQLYKLLLNKENFLIMIL